MPNKVRRFEDVEADLLKDPETRAAYDALETAYQVACRRIERGLTQAQLAEKVGTRQSRIARLEAGGRDPSVSYLRRVATALDCRLEIRLVPSDKADAGLGPDADDCLKKDEAGSGNGGAPAQ